MKNAEFDLATGAPIVPGRITVAIDDDSTVCPPPHEYLLLRFDLGGTSFDVPTLGIWPVTDSERCENGFNKTSTSCPIVFVPLSAQIINHIWRNEDSKGSILRVGYQCGQLATSQKPELGNAYGTITHYFTGFKVEVSAEEKGLALKLVGMLTRRRTWQVPPIISKLKKPSITVEMKLPWETLSLLGFIAVPGLSARGKFGVELSETSRNVFKLQDLLIADGLSWPLVKGFITVNPKEHRPKWQWYEEASYIVLSTIKENNLLFYNVKKVEILNNGFITTRNFTNSYSINLQVFGQQILNRVLEEKDTLKFSMSGDCLGYIFYETGYRLEASDHLGRIRQPIKDLIIEANLTSEGLELKISGEIDDFEAELIKEHRRERDSDLKPCETFEMQATLPWALLSIRGFTFASKASRFMNQTTDKS